jgi:hypothetical protein
MMTRLIFMMYLLAGTVPAANAFEYALDDGTGTFNIGPSQFDAQMLWGNYFDALPGYETITSISVSFAGSVPIGEPVTLLLFDDPDNDLNPTNAVPVAQATGMTVAAPSNTFIHFDIPDTPITGGFFVAAMMNLNQGQAAARMDPQSQHGRSWLFFDGEIDLNDLGGSPLYYNMADTPFNGTWMVRAVGVPEPGTLVLILIGAGLLRRKAA